MVRHEREEEVCLRHVCRSRGKIPGPLFLVIDEKERLGRGSIRLIGVAASMPRLQRELKKKTRTKKETPKEKAEKTNNLGVKNN